MTIAIIAFIGGLMIGAIFGIFTAGLVLSAREEDE